MGNRVTRAATHLSEEAVYARMQKEPRLWRRKLWEIIYQALTAPRKAEEIARTVGASVSTVHRVIAAYKREGGAAIETKGERWATSPVPDIGTRTRLPPALRGPCGARRESDRGRDPPRL